MYDFFYDFVGISAVVAILAGVRINRPESVLPWHLFALGELMAVMGDMTLNYYQNILHLEAPFPSFSDAFWLSEYPLLVAGLVLLIHRRAPGRDWAGLIDATILATSVGVFSWVFLMSPYAHDGSLSVLAKIISMAYPLMDVILLGVAARMAVAPGARTPAYRLLGLSLIFLLLSDTVYARMLLDGTYYTGSLPDLGYLLSYVLWGSAALHPTMRTLSDPAPERGLKLTRMRLALLAAAAISAPAIRGIQLIRDIPVDRPVIVLSSMTLALLVIARMAAFVRQHEHAISREKILRKAGAALVAAPDRESIYDAALRAVLELAGDREQTRASVAAGPPEKLLVVASSGDGAEEARGKRIDPLELSGPVLSGFVGQRFVAVEHVDPEVLQKALGFSPKTREIFVYPLITRESASSVLLVDTNLKFLEEFKDGLEALSSQVALALESEELAEDLHMRQSEERFRALVQNASDLILILDPDGILRYVSPSARRMLGRDPEEETGAGIFDWVHRDDAGRMQEALSKCLDTPESTEIVEVRLLHADGAWRRFEMVGNNLLGESRVEGIVFNARDITERKHAEEALREAERRFRTLVEQMPAVTYINPPDQIAYSTYISPQIEDLVGYSADEIKEDSQVWDTRIHPDDLERVISEEESAIATGEPFGTEYRVIARDGRIVWVRDECVLVRDEAGEPYCWQGFLWDISDRRQAEEALREAEARYRTLVEQVPAVIYIQEFGNSDSMRYLSPQFESIFGYSLEERLQDTEHWIKYVHPDDRERVHAEVIRTNETGDPFRMEYRQLTKDGRVIWIRDEAVLVRNDEGKASFWQGVMMDITERKVLEDKISYQAFHDTLTGLPNRTLFMDRLQHALDRITRNEGNVAVLFLDLDEFKVINDSLGHNAGDELLVAVAGRLRACVRPGDTVARLGGDEFTVLLEDILGTEEAVGVAERIYEELHAPFDLEGHEVFVTTSIGISMGSSGEEKPEGLLRNADVAMYEAKNNGKARHALFDPDMDARALERLQLESDLRRAIREEEFQVYYQPVVDLQTGRICEVEALVRWDHPERGLLSPNRFIPLAEKTGLIVPIGQWVLAEASRQVRAWQEQLDENHPLMLSVNLSPKQFQRADLVEDISRTLEETGLDPCSLKLEITEGVVMEDADSNVLVLQRLREMGVQIAIDDFGTGYSSLSYLKRFPVNVLKIDRSFVEGLGQIDEDTAVVRATVAFAKSMGLSVTAEGIENTEQLTYVRALGCDLGQGFYLHEPLSEKPLSRLLLEAEPRSAKPGTQITPNAANKNSELVKNP